MVFMALDIETTGLNPVKDRIVEIGAVLFNKEGILDTFQRFVNPEMIIPDRVINIRQTMITKKSRSICRMS